MDVKCVTNHRWAHSLLQEKKGAARQNLFGLKIFGAVIDFGA